MSPDWIMWVVPTALGRKSSNFEIAPGKAQNLTLNHFVRDISSVLAVISFRIISEASSVGFELDSDDSNERVWVMSVGCDLDCPLCLLLLDKCIRPGRKYI